MQAMKLGWVFRVVFGLACGVGWAEDWVEVPLHSTRTGEAGGYELGRLEVTVAEFVEYLKDTGGGGFPETEQIAHSSEGKYRPRRGTKRQAVSEVTATEAQAYSQWRSRESGRAVQLPTEAEWAASARGGVDGAPYPWGWGGTPSELAQFDAEGPAAQGGRFVANGFGVCDMAGNLYEWCAPSPGLPEGKRVARGGSWAERSRSFLDIEHRELFPIEYRGRDVGFRVLREPRSR